MKRVVIESPYAGDVERNRRYLAAAMLDSLQRGEAPFASHALYPMVLDDSIPRDRDLGIRAGLTWAAYGDLTAIYCDLGISEGMIAGIAQARALGRIVEYRNLRGEWTPPNIEGGT